MDLPVHGRHSFGEIPYGDVCFFSEVWVPATPTGRKLSIANGAAVSRKRE